MEELGPIAPAGVGRVGERNLGRLARVPRVLCCAHLGDRLLQREGGQWRSRRFLSHPKCAFGAVRQRDGRGESEREGRAEDEDAPPRDGFKL
eukprot:scaffold91509_cov34-Tisochrysis_lutea.AAC.2